MSESHAPSGQLGIEQGFRLLFLPLHRVVDSYYGAEFVWPLRLGISASEVGLRFTAVVGSIDARSRAMLERYGNRVVALSSKTASEMWQHSLSNDLGFYYGLIEKGIREGLGRHTLIHHAFLGFKRGFNPVIVSGMHRPAAIGPLLYQPNRELEALECVKQGIPVPAEDSPWQKRLLEKLYRSTLRNSDLIFFDVPETLSQLGTAFPEALDKKLVVLNSVGWPLRDSPRTDFSQRQPMKLLVVSRARPRKRIDTAIKALSRLPSGLFTLDIVGDGPSMPYLKRLIKELNVESRVTFRGPVDNARLRQIFDEYDLLIHLDILPALANGMIQEAVPAALPVAVSTESRVERPLDLPYGWQVDMEDPGVLAELLLKLYDNPGLLATKSHEALKFAAKEMSYRAVGNKIYKGYQSVLRQNGIPMALGEGPLEKHID
ncbi:MAG: glycosyltransferase [Thermoprotei archaeon]